MALSGLLSLAFITPAIATDFPGNLKGATISDAQTINQPPVASFTHEITGDTVTFDASGSSDPDGSILKYKWSFDDGSLAEGMTATKTLPEGTKRKVTLAVEDNDKGVALQQQTVAAVTQKIHDDFSTDTSANYTVLSGKALSVYDGALHAESWSTTVAFHNTSLESNDHSIEADVVYAPENGGGLMARCDPQQKTGYVVYFESGRVLLYTYNNGTITYLALYDGKYPSGTYRLSLSVTGSTITAAVNGAVVLTKTDSTFTKGTFGGIRLRTGADATPITVDNLVGN
jgi:hypothetical protein